MNVTIRQLRAFAVLAKVGSFTRAAEALHVTQPALSAQIRELESALAVRLFDRSTRRVLLTATGRDLLVLVDDVLGGLERLVTHAQGVTAREIGRVSIAALPSIAATVMPEAIVRFRAAHPGITVALHDATAGRVAELVRDGVADFGVSGAIVAMPGLAFESLGTDRMLAVMPRGHPLANTRRIGLPQLLRFPLILSKRDSSLRALVDQSAAALGRVVVPAFETTVMSTATSLVRAGLGVTLLPALGSALADVGDLVLRPIDDTSLARPIGFVRRSGRTLSPAADLFAQHVRTELDGWLSRSRTDRPGALRRSSQVPRTSPAARRSRG